MYPRMTCLPLQALPGSHGTTGACTFGWYAGPYTPSERRESSMEIVRAVMIQGTVPLV